MTFFQWSQYWIRRLVEYTKKTSKEYPDLTPKKFHCLSPREQWWILFSYIDAQRPYLQPDLVFIPKELDALMDEILMRYEPDLDMEFDSAEEMTKWGNSEEGHKMLVEQYPGLYEDIDIEDSELYDTGISIMKRNLKQSVPDILEELR